MLLSRQFLVSSLILLTQISFSAGAFEGKVTKGKVDFLATGKPSFLKIHGQNEENPQAFSGEVKINDKKVTGLFNVELKDLTTKLELRDDHMKNKYMEVGKYPQAQLSIKELILSENPLQLKKNLADQKFVGEMTFHGVTQPIEGVFALNPKDKSLEVHSEFKIKLSDFKIEVPTYMGIKVSDDVSVNVDYEISK